MGRIAIFSDIHSNLEALNAVLADMRAENITRFICLGDIVGYNANPSECLKIVRDLKCPVVKGNHDHEASSDNDLLGYRDLARISMGYSAAIFPRRKRIICASCRSSARRSIFSSSMRLSSSPRNFSTSIRRSRPPIIS